MTEGSTRSRAAWLVRSRAGGSNSRRDWLVCSQSALIWVVGRVAGTVGVAADTTTGARSTRATAKHLLRSMLRGIGAEVRRLCKTAGVILHSIASAARVEVAAELVGRK
jgi:hypothetical protein